MSAVSRAMITAVHLVLAFTAGPCPFAATSAPSLRLATPVASATPGQNTPRSVEVAIIGGGPCGLATALALSKSRSLQGATVEVFESDAFRPKGASILISKAGWAALNAIDPDTARRIRTTSAPVTRVSVRTLGGANLTPAPVRVFMTIVGALFALLRRVGIQRGLLGVHLWHEVREVLRQRAEASGAVLSPSKTLVEMTEGADAMRLRFDDGDEVAAKVVLACDGVSSACRHELLLTLTLTLALTLTLTLARRLLPSEPDDLLLDEGKSAWRGQAVGLDSGREATFYKDDTGRSGLVFPAGAGQGSSWTFIASSVAGRSQSPEEARARLAAALPDELDATLRQAIDASPFLIESKLQTRDFSKPWASATPRVAFLGDAAHPLRPTGEGTALALEDAWTVGSLALTLTLILALTPTLSLTLNPNPNPNPNQVGSLAAVAETADAFCQPATLRKYEAARYVESAWPLTKWPLGIAAMIACYRPAAWDVRL